MSATGFNAWLVERGGGRFTRLDETDLDDGDVLVRVKYSAVARRDALACTGREALVRRFPCVGGSDLLGEVIASAAPRFKPGDEVLATGYGLGVNHHGGFAERALLPGGWLLPRPAELADWECMALGSAGLAVAMAISRLENNGLKREMGPVLVSGATGGVGSLAVALLANRGYEVVALTGRPGLAEWLRTLGASKVMTNDELHPVETSRLSRKGVWAAAIDNCGGDVLGWILASAKPGAGVVAMGSVAGDSMQSSLMPFVWRGVSLFGVDSVHAGFVCREKAWSRLSGDLQSCRLSLLCRVVGFKELPVAFEQLLGRLVQGRTVVRIAD